jgi:2-phospho-L-lactate/phosphoenolpyruvate guanylyltransferase
MSQPRTCTIVPVKALDRAKRRLSPVLPDAARQRLVLTMLEDVLLALAGVESNHCVMVVTPDARVADLARSHGATVVPDPGASDLNAAVATGLAYVAARGFGRALILPADVPLATTEELGSLIESRGSQPGVTLAPSHDSNGTNGMLLAPPGAIAPCYGPGSYLEHLSQAMARRVDVNVVHLAGLARDIDEPADLAALLAAKTGAGGRYDFLGLYLAAGGYTSGRTATAEEQ